MSMSSREEEDSREKQRCGSEVEALRRQLEKTRGALIKSEDRVKHLEDDRTAREHVIVDLKRERRRLNDELKKHSADAKR